MVNIVGETSYQYTVTSPTGKVPTNFLVLTKGRQVDSQGLEGDIHGSIGGVAAGSYVRNGSTAIANCPSSSIWTSNKKDDGWCFPTVAITDKPTLKVSERFNPEEGQTNIIIGNSSVPKVCGPILGPTTPAAPAFVGSPLIETTVTILMQNGCSYFATYNSHSRVLTSITPDPATPHATVDPFEACAVTPSATTCEAQMGVVYCPESVIGQTFFQTTAGGLCPVKIGGRTYNLAC
jgi:hypothetical protein